MTTTTTTATQFEEKQTRGIRQNIAKSESRRLLVTIVGSVLLSLIALVVGVLYYEHSTATESVVVTKAFIAQGEPFRAIALTTESVKLPADIEAIPSADLPALGNYFAKSDIQPGTILTPADITTRPNLPPGIVLVTLTLPSNGYPPFLAPDMIIDLIPNNLAASQLNSNQGIMRVFMANYYSSAETGSSPLAVIELNVNEIPQFQQVTGAGFTVGIEPGLNGPNTPNQSNGPNNSSSTNNTTTTTTPQSYPPTT